MGASRSALRLKDRFKALDGLGVGLGDSVPIGPLVNDGVPEIRVLLQIKLVCPTDLSVLAAISTAA